MTPARLAIRRAAAKLNAPLRAAPKRAPPVASRARVDALAAAAQARIKALVASYRQEDEARRGQ